MEKVDILNAARKLEEDGQAFYLDTASKAKNGIARQTFESFAKDEGNHIRWIDGMLAGEGSVPEDAETVKEVYASLKSIFADVTEDSKGQLATSEDEIKAIEIAMGKEEGSIKAYSEWKDASEDADVKTLFQTLVDVEKAHYSLLENTKTYLDSTGDWFMVDEQWSFDG